LVDVATLVERCRQGDSLAWEALVRMFQGRVYAVAFHYMRNPEEARDVAQEVFVRVYRRLDSFHGAEGFQAWILSVARNACIDALRRRKARPPAEDLPVETGPELAADAPTPQEAAETEANRRLLYRALDGMKETSREIILLKEIQGLKFEEIAEMLSLPVGTVKSRSNRARVELAARVRLLDPSYGT